MASWLDPISAGRVEADLEIARLREENFALAAWQCLFHDGKTGIVNDEHGNQYCAMEKENARLREENAKLREVDEWRCEQLRKAQERIRNLQARSGE